MMDLVIPRRRLIITLMQGNVEHRILDDDITAGQILVDWNREMTEIRTNPRLFALMAGAPPAAWQDLPGDTIMDFEIGREIRIRYGALNPYSASRPNW